MHKTEKRILELITNNKFLTQDLKNRYIMALFLMNSDEQQEYLEIMEAFSARCEKIDQGIFVIPANEQKRILRTVQEVKDDLIKKIQTNNEPR